MKEKIHKDAYIDCLRGVAILLVIATHIKGIVPNCSAVTNAVTSFGRMGVQLFFVVSACTLYRSWQSRGYYPRRLGEFYLRRYFRIAPLYYFGIGLYCVSSTIKHYCATGELEWPEQFELLSLISNFTLLHAFHPAGNNNIVPGGWSIATEFMFYILFPLIMTFFGGTRPRTMVAITSVYLLLLLSLHLALMNLGFRMELGDFWYHSLPNQLTVFLLGIAVASHIRNQDFSCSFLPGFIISGLFLILVFLMWNHPSSVTRSALPFLGACCFAFLTKSMSSVPPAFLDRHFHWLSQIGKFSYSMYVWHFIIIDILKTVAPHEIMSHGDLSLIGFYLVVCLITFLVAATSVKWIENPGIALGKRIGNRSAKTPA